MTVQQALPLFAKLLIKSQEEMKEKKQELELSIICEDTKWVHKVLDRPTTDKITAEAQESIENEDNQMS